jgi:prolyl-tRNA editing enzyme YbaK/EbsC (Cys-tRNA(Pro) deacylase)
MAQPAPHKRPPTAWVCMLGQIAKSVIFKRKEDGVAVLVVTSGDRRVDEKKVSALVGKVGRADADFVKAQTGFTIGGVSPVAHLNPPVTLLDQDLWRFEDGVGGGWASACRVPIAP